MECSAPLDKLALQRRNRMPGARMASRVSSIRDISGSPSVPVYRADGGASVISPHSSSILRGSASSLTRAAFAVCAAARPGKEVRTMDDVSWCVTVVYWQRRVVVFESKEGRQDFPMDRMGKDCKGEYAALLTILMALGPIWEVSCTRWRDLDMKYHGVATGKCPASALYSLDIGELATDKERLLQDSFEARCPTDTTVKKYNQYLVWDTDMAFQNLSSSSSEFLQRVLHDRGFAGMSPKEPLLEIEDLWRPPNLQGIDWQDTGASSSNRHAYATADAFGDEEPWLWTTLETTKGDAPQRGLMAPFYGSSTYRHLAEKFAAKPETWEQERPSRAEMDDEEVDDGPGGGDYAEVAWFDKVGTRHPHLDRPGDFMKRLLPGIPMPSLNELKARQLDDPLCKQIVVELQELESSKDALVLESRPVRARTSCEANGAVRLLLRVETWGRRKQQLLHYKKIIDRAEKNLRAYELAPDGVLMHKGEAQDGGIRLEYVIPECYRATLLTAAHDCSGHKGRHHTLDFLRVGRVWWPGIRSDVNEKCRRCKACAMSKRGKHVGEQVTPSKGFEPWQVTCVDIVDLEETPSGYSKAVIFADRLGGGIRASPATANIDSGEFLNIILYTLIAEGIKPCLLISDHDSIMISALCDAYYAAFNIARSVADGHMHTAVGQCERFNGVLRAMARAAHYDSGCLWDVYLPLLVLFHNSTRNLETGYSPYYLEHGREPSLPWSLAELGPDADAPDLVRRHAEGLHMALELCRQHRSRVEAARREEHNRKYQTNVKFLPGQRVLVLQPGPHFNKMLMPYIGPFRIVEGPDDRSRYRLRDLGVSNLNPWFHISRLKWWPDSANDLTDVGEEYYIVERIVGHRVVGSPPRYEFEVKWKGYSSNWNTFCKEEQFNMGARSMPAQYLARLGLPNKPAIADPGPSGSQSHHDQSRQLGVEGSQTAQQDIQPTQQADERAARREARARAREAQLEEAARA